jgi:hypothetical protein
MKAVTSRSKFAPGSIIVREKRSAKDNEKPELLAAMIKREPGFNPIAGDWLFLTINGQGTKVKSKQKEGTCLSCHQVQWQTDFVYPLEQATVSAK